MARKRIDEAQKNWERQMSTAPKYWKMAIENAVKSNSYCKGIAEFVGVRTCNPEIGEKWEDRVKAVTESDYARAVQGKGAVWRKNYIKKTVGTVREDEE